MLPDGKRVDDPPRKGRLDAVRFRLKLLAVKYPIQIAFIIALFALLIPVYMLVESNAQLRSDASQLRKSNSKVSDSLVYIQESRRVITREFCGVINDNSASTNAQNDYLQTILIGSVKQSRSFEATFRKLGLPPYRERLKQAKERADALAAFKVPSIDCGDLFTQIDCQIEALRVQGDPRDCIGRREARP